MFDINTSKDEFGTAIVLTNNSLYQIYNFYTESNECFNNDATIDFNNFIYESIRLPGKLKKLKKFSSRLIVMFLVIFILK